MGKCLVTKLQGKVSGDLPYFGALKITVKKTDNITLATQRRLVLKTTDDNCRIFTADGSSKLSDKEDLSNPSSSFVYKDMHHETGGDNRREIYFLDGDYTVLITSKYNIAMLSHWGQSGNFFFDIEELKYSHLLTEIRVGKLKGLTGDISSLSGLTKLANLTLDGSYVTGDISSLKDLTALTYLSFSAPNITGDISSLSGLTKLANLTLDGSYVTGDISSLKDLTALTYLSLNDDLKVIGTFESLVSALSAKRTSGSCLYWLSGSNITYNGERWITGKKFVEFNSGGCNVYDGTDNTGKKIASYVKSTSSWSYID